MDIKTITQQLISVLKKYKKLLIYINGSPDPDVIAASFCLKIVAELYSTEISIISLLPVSLPQNQALIRELAIPISFLSEFPEISEYNAYIILDHQNTYIEEIDRKIPCALHIDHHEVIEKKKIIPELEIITAEVGSVSTIIALILKELELNLYSQIMSKISTALYYGISTDTDNFTHTKEPDNEAVKFLSKDINKKIIRNINSIPFSEETITILSTAMLNHIIYKGWLISGVGIIHDSFRDSIAVIADFLLERENVTTVVVFALIENDEGHLHLDTSLRTENPQLNLNNFIKTITQNGGARHYKGAYQIDLDYFSKCPDKKLLWQVIKQSTEERIKYQIDNFDFAFEYKLVTKFKEKLRNLFRF